MMGMLLPLGIEKGKDFKPDVATAARLNSAAAEAHAWMFETTFQKARRSPLYVVRAFRTFGLTF
jgi:hypothetical protein